MGWVKIDDRMAEHPKLVTAGPLAGYLHLCAIQYANRNRTDGFIPTRAIYTLIDLGSFGVCRGFYGKDSEPDYSEVYAHELAEALVAVHLWEPAAGGYCIHDYLEYQQSATEIEEYRARDRARKPRRPRENSRKIPRGIQTDSKRIPEKFQPDSPVEKEKEKEKEKRDRDEEEDVSVPSEPQAASAAVRMPEVKTPEDNVKGKPIRTLDNLEAESANGQAPDPVDWVFAYYREVIQPAARLCPREKIKARLKRFQVDELTQGIEHFAADAWWMEHNGTRGAGWFFHSDARSEQFLNMDPRAAEEKNPLVRSHRD